MFHVCLWSRCRFAYGPADATATHYLLLQEIQIGFTYLVPGVCVYLCVRACVLACGQCFNTVRWV